MIELRSVSVGYGKQNVLKNVSLNFEKGRLIGIIGANGCGKSTLLKTVLGMVPAEDGNISVDGKSLDSMSRVEVARKISYLAQSKSAPDMTVEQLVLHGRFPHLSYPRRYTKADRDIARAAMEQAGVAAHAKKSMQALSGGMRQAAYIAMALAQDTEYVFLDEPTTYLDISHQLELMRLLRGLTDGGKSIVAVMHDLPIAFTFCDSIVLLDGGEVAAHGSPAELCARDEIERVFGVSLECREDKSYNYKLNCIGKRYV